LEHCKNGEKYGYGYYGQHIVLGNVRVIEGAPVGPGCNLDRVGQAVLGITIKYNNVITYLLTTVTPVVSTILILF